VVSAVLCLIGIGFALLIGSARDGRTTELIEQDLVRHSFASEIGSEQPRTLIRFLRPWRANGAGIEISDLIRVGDTFDKADTTSTLEAGDLSYLRAPTADLRRVPQAR
jgi:hypothetical protein